LHRGKIVKEICSYKLKRRRYSVMLEVNTTSFSRRFILKNVGHFFLQ
jgi:hypothetical protein